MTNYEPLVRKMAAFWAYEAMIDFILYYRYLFQQFSENFAAEKLRILHENFIGFSTCQCEHTPLPYLCWLRRYEQWR
jgi:hypothetical protein